MSDVYFSISVWVVLSIQMEKNYLSKETFEWRLYHNALCANSNYGGMFLEVSHQLNSSRNISNQTSEESKILF